MLPGLAWSMLILIASAVKMTGDSTIIMRLHSVLFLIGWLGSLQSLLYLYRETGHVACSLRSVMSMSKPTAF